MGNSLFLAVAIFVFVLLAIGLGLTILEFRYGEPNQDASEDIANDDGASQGRLKATENQPAA